MLFTGLTCYTTEGSLTSKETQGLWSTWCSSCRVLLGMSAHDAELVPVCPMSLGYNPAMHPHTPGWGAAQCGLQDAHPILPVFEEAVSCLQGAVTAVCLPEPSHQAPTSMGACTGSNRWVYFSNQLVLLACANNSVKNSSSCCQFLGCLIFLSQLFLRLYLYSFSYWFRHEC